MYHASSVWSSLFSAVAQSSPHELQNSAYTLIRLSSCLAQPGLEAHGVADKLSQGQKAVKVGEQHLMSLVGSSVQF